MFSPGIQPAYTRPKSTHLSIYNQPTHLKQLQAFIEVHANMSTRLPRFQVPVICFTLLIAALFAGCATAAGATKAEKYPTGNINLSPFDQWLNAYYCLQTASCETKYQLTYWGWKNLTSADTQDYCRPGGCREQTVTALTCVSLVKPGFKFVDATTVRDVNNTINQGCANGFTGAVLKMETSSAENLTGSSVSFAMSFLVSMLVMLISVG
uniref:DUF7731 domain-containing protein n=1 Tax=Kalanchoe fedtschenkoi TaxID=63787 RepID=A0A7N0UHD1_KALFE